MVRHIFFLFMVTYVIYSEGRIHRPIKGIVGGYQAVDGQLTYQVSLMYNDKNECGGGILNEKYILTAAHCVININTGKFLAKQYTVVMGTVDLKEKDSALRILVDAVMIPKNYNQRSKLDPNDIAVLKLEKRIDFKKYHTLKKLLTASDPLKTYDGSTATISGFGWNVVEYKYNEQRKKMVLIGMSFNKLRWAKTEVQTIVNCNADRMAVDKDAEQVTPNHICAKMEQRSQDKPEGACSHDSGSPLVIHSETGITVIGVLILSPNLCQENKMASVYTRVSNHKNFIETALKGKPHEYLRFAYFDEKKDKSGQMKTVVLEVAPKC